MDERLLFYSDLFAYVKDEFIIPQNTENKMAEDIAKIANSPSLIVKAHLDNTKKTNNDEINTWLMWLILNLSKDLNVRYQDVSFEDKDIAQFISENNLFQLNTTMLPRVIEQLSGQFEHRQPYGSVVETKTQSLIDYVKRELKELMSNFSLSDENEATIISLLTDANVSCKPEIIQIWKGRITDVSTITDASILIELFKQNKVSPVWENVIKYYEVIKLTDKTLQTFIMHNQQALTQETVSIPKQRQDAFMIKFSESTVEENAYLCALKKMVTEFSRADYPKANVELIIKNRRYTKTTSINQIYLNIQSSHPTLLPLFVTVYWNELEDYMKQSSAFSVPEKICIDIFQNHKELFVYQNELSALLQYAKNKIHTPLFWNEAANFLIELEVKFQINDFKLFLQKVTDPDKKKYILEYMTNFFTKVEMEREIKTILDTMELSYTQLKKKYQKRHSSKNSDTTPVKMEA
jgi:hypothetical protein